MKEPSKEYLFLFNLMSCAAEDMQDLQDMCENTHTRATELILEANKRSTVQGVLLMEQTLSILADRCRAFKIMFETAQRKAEEIFLSEGD